MISYAPAENEHFDELLELVYHQEDGYLKPILDLIQLTYDQFGQIFRTTGTAYRILVDGCLAGLCWVEVCARVLRLHGLILKPAFRGQGIGARTLGWLEEAFSEEVDTIELMVHASNPRARALYERCGYVTPGACQPSGFYSMRKKIRQPAQLQNKRGRLPQRSRLRMSPR